jgi:hypothetical protein
MARKRKPMSEETKSKIGLASKGYKHTPETKRKMSEAHKGKPRIPTSEATKQKISKANKGKPKSEEHKFKLSETHKGKLISVDTKFKISKALKGRLVSEETKQKMSEANKGKPKSEVTKLEMSIAQRGENHPNWQGGITNDPYSNDWTDTLKESIRQRDLYTCQECGITQDKLNKKLSVHHIDYNKENLNPTNLISLCRSCHAKTNYNRIQWYEYFMIKYLSNPFI